MEKTVHQTAWINIVYFYVKLKHDLLLISESLGPVKEIFVHKEVISSHHSSTGNGILLCNKYIYYYILFLFFHDSSTQFPFSLVFGQGFVLVAPSYRPL
jgi:hypothetical protein